MNAHAHAERRGRGDAVRRGPHQREEPRRGHPQLPRRRGRAVGTGARARRGAAATRRRRGGARDRRVRSGAMSSTRRDGRSPLMIQLFHVYKAYPGDPPVLSGHQPARREGRVRLPHRALGRGEDDAAQAHLLRRAGRPGQILVGRPQHRAHPRVGACPTCAATSGWCSRTSSCCPRARSRRTWPSRWTCSASPRARRGSG